MASLPTAQLTEDEYLRIERVATERSEFHDGQMFAMAGGSRNHSFLTSSISSLLYQQKPDRPAKLAAALPGAYKLLAGKYYVDQIYGACVVKPLLLFSKYFLSPVVDKALLGGTAWLLGGVPTFAGALLQRWQSGNLRSYAAWLTAGAAAVLIFVVVPWYLVWPASLDFVWKVARH